MYSELEPDSTSSSSGDARSLWTLTVVPAEVGPGEGWMDAVVRGRCLEEVVWKRLSGRACQARVCKHRPVGRKGLDGDIMGIVAVSGGRARVDGLLCVAGFGFSRMAN